MRDADPRKPPLTQGTVAESFWKPPPPDREDDPGAPLGSPGLRKFVRERRLVVSDGQRRATHWAVILVLLGIAFVYFDPSLLFVLTTTTGGDTGAHIYGVSFAREHLIPSGFQAMWSPHWLGGVPMIHFYFPLVIGAQALLSYVIPFEIAFKLGTIAGPILLPIAVFWMLRWLRFEFPTPLLGGALSIGFLFMDSFSIYGGNLLSTLAGEYTFSVSLALSFLFIGLAYRTVTEDRGRPVVAAFVLAGVVLSHSLPAIMLVFSLPLFAWWAIRTHGRRAGLERLGTMFGLAFCLTAFWSIPMVTRIHYTTSFNVAPVRGLSIAFPRQIWIYAVCFIFGGIVALLRRDRRFLIFAAPGLAALVLYFLAPRGLVWNGRWLPFWYLAAFFGTAYLLGAVIPTFTRLVWRRRATVMALALVVLTIVAQGAWIVRKKATTAVDDWLAYNYEGYEDKEFFPKFQRIHEALDALPAGRLTTEDSSHIAEFGSSFAFLSLPYWVDQSTLEGLYFESSLTTPFLVLLQNEMSEAGPQSISGLPYRSFDFEAAAEHMRVLGVDYYISVTESAKAAAEDTGDFDAVEDIEKYTIHTVEGDTADVVVPDYEPVVTTDEWREASVEWWSNLDTLDVPITREGPLEWERTATLEDIPRTPLEHAGESYEAEVDESGEIRFTTEAVGEPHWVKYSYFPNWRVEGAEGPYLATPSMMMVVPTESEVVLTYERTWAEWLGLLLTLVALGALVVPVSRRWMLEWGGSRPRGGRHLTR